MPARPAIIVCPDVGDPAFLVEEHDFGGGSAADVVDVADDDCFEAPEDFQKIEAQGGISLEALTEVFAEGGLATDDAAAVAEAAGEVSWTSSA